MNCVKLLQLATKKGDLVYSSFIKKKYVVIDFYNIYCSLISFNKHKIFTKQTVALCMEKIMGSVFVDQEVIVVSKNIFEFNNDDILYFTKKYKTLTYIVVKDNFYTKSKNKERDDYTCILVNSILKGSSVVISNDKYSNLACLVKDIKPFTLEVFKKDFCSVLEFNEKTIESTFSNAPDSVDRIGFYFKRRKIY